MDLWLPLTQDTRQQGLSNASVTAVGSGATINANGKLGKCYYLDGTSNGYITTDFPTNVGTNDFTISLWVKIPTISTGNYYAVVSSKTSSASSAGVGIYWNYTQKKFLWSTADGTNATEIWMADAVDTIVYDKWIHLVMVRDNNDAKKGYFYINGTRYELASVPVIRNITTATNLWIGRCSSGNYPLKMYISDIKFWKSKALSPKEIEILSRGLVCHYPLNGGGRGGDNLLIYSNVTETNFTALKNRGIGTWNKLSLTTKDGYDCYLYDKSLSSTAFSTGAWYSGMKANTTYTYSAWIYFTASANFNFTSLGHFQVYNSNSTASDKSHEDIANARIYEPSTIPANKWTKIRITFTTNNLANSYFQVYPRYNIGANVGDLYFRDMKLEEGNHTTPWMPNSADTAYSAMGYDSTTEYDVSGYGYNGTKNGTLTYLNDTARYSVSTKFASTTYIETPSPCSNVRSASFWIKTDKTAYAVAWADAKSKLAFGIVSSGDILVSCNSGTTKKYPNSVITANVWQHIVIVRGEDIANTDLYVNGVKQTPGTSTDFWTHTSDSLIINGRGYSTPSRMNSQMSDFRLYATTLSAAQVADLYNTAVSVSNNGALLGYELIEN